jgi:DNA invertase Pin-like site-specific DNA recombinase
MSTCAYLRCSSDAQDTLRQREAIDRSGIKIDHWLEDHESRDKAHKRHDFQRLLKAVQAGQVDTIVVASLDRFGVKDAYEMGKFFSVLRDHNCRLLDASGKQLNADDDATILTSTIGAMTSSREQKEKAARVLTGKVTLARKGNFLGGYCPYGMDVVAFDQQGNEAWRCVIEGHDKRVKVFPDGRQERFDGKGNVPPKALHETLKYRPSIIAERVKYVRLIFDWFTTEAISPGQIATRLNDLGVSPVYGPLWHQGVVKYLLSNAVYVGRPTYNKASQSRFMEFVDGQVKTASRSTASRKRVDSDQIRPDKPEFPAIVEPEVFDKAQAKLLATKTQAYRAPKTAHLWLKGFIVCSRCKKIMRAQSGNRRNCLAPGYVCVEYARWGSRSPSGCGHFRVEHEEIESLVLDYMTKTAPQLKALLDASTADNLEAARPLLDAISETNMEMTGVWHEMAVFTVKYSLGEANEPMSMEALYEAVYAGAKPRIAKAIAEKETELETLLDGFAGLSPKLKDRANQRGEALQKEIDTLQRNLQDLRIPWERLRTELAARQEALELATATLNQEGHFRQKAEALKTVIGRIVCHFGRKGKRCFLKSIDIYAPEVAAVRPLTFLESPHSNSCQGAKCRAGNASEGEYKTPSCRRLKSARS